MNGSITFLVPTLGRPSLAATLRSIECWSGDEILVVSAARPSCTEGDERVRFLSCPPGGDWGHTERNFAAHHAHGDYVAHIDDDDIYLPGARAAMGAAISGPPARPTIFRMRYPNGITLWADQVLRCGNVGTPMMLIPNTPDKFGTWGSFVGGDYHFLASSKWRPEEFGWRPEVVALLGHN